MDEEKIRERALTNVKAKNPGLKKFRVDAVVEDFLGGTLITVESVDEEGAKVEDIVHVKDGEMLLFNDVEEMAKVLRGQNRGSPLDRLLQIGGISGVVAVLTVATICYLAVTGKDVPDVLSNAVGLVIGFYFGNQVAR